MKLSHELAKIFEREFDIVFEKEKADKDFLKQEDFSSCRERAEAGIKIAIGSAINTLGLTIAIHEEKEHGLDTLDEQAKLMTEMIPDDIEVGTREFWNQ